MIEDELQPPYLAVRVVYLDLPDLIEVEVRAVNGRWSGTTCAYASPERLREEAHWIIDWARNPQGECTLEAGADTGIGWLRLRFYCIDLAGHVCCEIQMAKPTLGGRKEIGWRLSLEIRTEPGLMERFANHLLAIVTNVRAAEIIASGGITEGAGAILEGVRDQATDS